MGRSSQRILAIGPHPDDVELGCFGTLARFDREGAAVHILCLSAGELGLQHLDSSQARLGRRKECERSAALINASVHVANLPDGGISDGLETIHIIEEQLELFKPTIVLMPSPNDTHQDHRNTALAAQSATRSVPNTVLVYQTPSTTTDFSPVYHVDVTEVFGLKLEAIKIHRSQDGKSYMAEDAVKGLAKFRAYEIGRLGQLYESFEVRRVIRNWRKRTSLIPSERP